MQTIRVVYVGSADCVIGSVVVKDEPKSIPNPQEEVFYRGRSIGHCVEVARIPSGSVFVKVQ